MRRKSLKLSISQLKKINHSIAQWAGLYILEIKEVFDNKNTIVGNMFHTRVETGSDTEPMKFMNSHIIENMDRMNMLDQYRNLKDHYAYYTTVEPGDHEVKIEYTYNDTPFIAIIDLVTHNKRALKDWKTVTKFTDPTATRPNWWSGLTTYEEYELQAWQYMIASGIKRVEFVEFLKNADVYKKNMPSKGKVKGDRKVDPEDSHNVIGFDWSDSWAEAMAEKRDPKIEEAKETWEKYKPSVKDIE